jgi:hypothetical protein
MVILRTQSRSRANDPNEGSLPSILDGHRCDGHRLTSDGLSSRPEWTRCVPFGCPISRVLCEKWESGKSSQRNYARADGMILKM